MNREPDWESLSNINFLIHRRMSEHLNAALAAISLVSEGDEEQPPEFWLERAMTEVHNSLNLHTAWASLVRHKLGEHFLPQNMLQFRAGDLLHSVVNELQLTQVESLPEDIVLCGNRESLQEALLLLHSAANTLGPHVRVEAEAVDNGMYFRIRYDSMRSAPPTLDALLALLDSRPDSWRAQSAAFEIRSARDFLAMNTTDLHYQHEQGVCEFAFYVDSTGRVPSGAGITRHVDNTTVYGGGDTTDTVIAVDS